MKTKIWEKLLPIAIRLTMACIHWRMHMRPIHLRKGNRFEAVWMQSMTYKIDPDGVRFYLRCYDANDMERTAGTLPNRVYVLDYQDIYSEKGKYVCDRQTSRAEDGDRGQSDQSLQQPRH